jgi:hypothetical protein
MATRWIRLDGFVMALNAPDVKRFLVKHAPEKYSPIIAWGTYPEIIFKKVPADIRHLVFNSHGEPTPKIKIGNGITASDITAFDPLFQISPLKIIWMYACYQAGSPAGVAFCSLIAKRTGCYVVASVMALPDRYVRVGHIEDYQYAMPRYFDLAGNDMPRDDFFNMGKNMGFFELLPLPPGP